MCPACGLLDLLQVAEQCLLSRRRLDQQSLEEGLYTGEHMGPFTAAGPLAKGFYQKPDFCACSAPALYVVPRMPYLHLLVTALLNMFTCTWGASANYGYLYRVQARSSAGTTSAA